VHLLIQLIMETLLL